MTFQRTKLSIRQYEKKNTDLKQQKTLLSNKKKMSWNENRNQMKKKIKKKFLKIQFYE